MAVDSLPSGHRPRPAVLLILDGFGIAPDSEGNAITRANTPTFDMLTARYPVMTLRASGEHVGLSWGEMGNSEVGHLTIGAGRVYYQTLPRINRAVADGTFAANPALLSATAKVQQSGGTLHIMGLVSAGKVHSFDEHCVALLQLAKSQGLSKVAVHAMLDGRDTLYNSGIDFVTSLEAKMKEIGVGVIASLSGRYYAMDRDNRWDRVEKAYNAIALGKAESVAASAVQAIQHSYAEEVYDEEFLPTVIMKKEQPIATVQPGDAIIFFNFRPDRARELTKAFVLPSFDKFSRTYISDVTFVTMTEYEANLPVTVAFPPALLSNTLAEVVANNGMVQLHIAETEKYAHVTFFMNGTREEPFPHEDRVIVPSPNVASYDKAPAMSSEAVADRVVKEIGTGNYDVLVVNVASPDMVGHTGSVEATTQAVEVVDGCVRRIVDAVLAADGVLFITADHGNAEEVLNLQTHDIDKEHSTNPVPFWIIGKDYEGKTSPTGDVPNGDLSLVPPIGMLADVAPTILKVLGLPQPPEMTGTPLV